MALATVSTPTSLGSFQLNIGETRRVNSLSQLRRLGPDVREAMFENILFMRTLNLDGTPRGFAAESAVIARNASIHSTSLILARVVIEEDTRIGYHCTIGTGSTISNNVRIHTGVIVGDEAKVGARSILKILSRVGNRATIGEQVDVGFNVQIGEAAAVFDGSVLESNVTVGPNAIIAKGCLLETFAKVGADVRLGDRGMMERHSEILPHSGTWTHVSTREVVGGPTKKPFYLEREYLEKGPFGRARR